jgi:hypothetical protein
MFIFVCRDRVKEAAAAAELLIRLFEKHPILLTLTREPDATHILLDSALILGNARLSKRIAVIKRALPAVPESPLESSFLQKFYRCIRDKLTKRTPPFQLPVPIDADGCELDDQLEEHFTTEDSMLVAVRLRRPRTR